MAKFESSVGRSVRRLDGVGRSTWSRVDKAHRTASYHELAVVVPGRRRRRVIGHQSAAARRARPSRVHRPPAHLYSATFSTPNERSSSGRADDSNPHFDRSTGRFVPQRRERRRNRVPPTLEIMGTKRIWSSPTFTIGWLSFCR